VTLLHKVTGSGVEKEGVTGGGRWQPVNLKILPDLGTLRRPIWWVAACGPGFVISPLHPASYLVGIKTRGEKKRVVGVLGWQMMMRMILCHTTHAMLCCAGRKYLLFLFW
jgi:hypothetical protein